MNLLLIVALSAQLPFFGGGKQWDETAAAMGSTVRLLDEMNETAVRTGSLVRDDIDVQRRVMSAELERISGLSSEVVTRLESAEKSLRPIQPPAVPVQPAPVPVDPSLDRTERPVQPVARPVEPVERRAEPAPRPVQPVERGAEPIVVDRSSPEKLYRAATSTYLRSEFEQSIALFGEMLQTFPDHPKSRESLYWRADCYRRLERYAEAANDLHVFITKTSAHPLLAGALDRRARCLDELGRTQEAEQLRARLLAQFPESTEARRLRQEGTGRESALPPSRR